MGRGAELPDRSGRCSVAGNLSFEVATSQARQLFAVWAGDKKGTRLGRIARAVAVRFARWGGATVRAKLTASA